jgi:uncharacterized protein
MSKMIFVSLAVRDLAKAKVFYTAIGATINPQCSDDTGACMVFSETIHAILLTHEKWAGFSKKPISDAHVSSEVALTLSAESRDEVDAMAEAAGKAGGNVDASPPQDYGFMFARSFEDPDGHVWKAMWMDPKEMPANG